MTSVKILIVEDESIIAREIASQLKRLGYTVVAIVDTGEDAIITATATEPDLVLMDIVLQGDIDGIEAAHYIQTLWQIPVVYLTAYADENTLARAKITEPFGYILKPFNESTLQATIEMALSRHQAETRTRKNLEYEKELRKNAEELAELRSRYVAMTAHDFRTPLATIQMSADMLEAYSDRWSEEKKHKHLARIKIAIKNMNQLMEDVLLISQAESKVFDCHFIEFNLVDFCQQVVEEIQLGTSPKILINFVSHNLYESACMDVKLLRHILTNLLSNAIKYSPEGGTVDLILSGEENKIILQIKDRGIGIPEADQKKLFTNFYRGQNVGKIPGTGLGLAIVKRCVEIQRGEISVESQLGSGTTFTVKLPLNQL